jgi:hypothetical protein
MRARLFALAAIGLWPCLVFSQVEVTSIAPKGTIDREEVGQFQSVIKNATAQPLSGAILASLTITGPAKIDAVTSNNPAMTCNRATSPTVQAFVCNANPITLGVAESITLVTTFTADSMAEYGRVIDLRTLVVCGGTFETHSQVRVEETGGDPLLKITIGKYDPAGGPAGPHQLAYRFTVTNHGNGPTTLPIDVDITPQHPQDGPPVISSGWERPGTVIRHRMNLVLQPGQSWQTPWLEFRTVRGTYRVTALVAGGGSPPDEKTDVHQVIPREAESTEEPPPQPVEGRQR